jgi:hypothetical protein
MRPRRVVAISRPHQGPVRLIFDEDAHFDLQNRHLVKINSALAPWGS